MTFPSLQWKRFRYSKVLRTELIRPSPTLRAAFSHDHLRIAAAAVLRTPCLAQRGPGSRSPDAMGGSPPDARLGCQPGDEIQNSGPATVRLADNTVSNSRCMLLLGRRRLNEFENPTGVFSCSCSFFPP